MITRDAPLSVGIYWEIQTNLEQALNSTEKPLNFIDTREFSFEGTEVPASFSSL